MSLSKNDVKKKASRTSRERDNLLWLALTIREGTTTKIPKKTYKQVTLDILYTST
jgi:hypothetical protein